MSFAWPAYLVSLAIVALFFHPCAAHSQDRGSREINTDNVSTLTLTFSFRTGSAGGQAGAPAIGGTTLFVLTPFPHTLLALDLSRPDDPVKWRFAPEPNWNAEGLGGPAAVSLGPAIADGHVFINTLDGHTIALDAATGSVIWNAETAHVGSGETLTSSPLIADGKVFVGNSGDDFGVRGWIAALDAGVGRELWRRWSTGPDADVGIGTAFKPFYPDARGTDRGVSTWVGTQWQHGGGSVSGPILFDPQARILFHGTGHPAPWNPDAHRGGNKWTSGLFGRDIATGDARWFIGVNPHDRFAFGSARTGVLADREWRGAPRKLLIHPDPNGFVYVIDRTSGEILAADPYVNSNAMSGVDLASGRPRMLPERASRQNTTTRDVCPGWPGALGGEPAPSPDGRLLFIPASRLCMDFEARNASFIPGTAFVGANVRAKAPPDAAGGALVAWDVDAGKPAWTVAEKFPVASGILALGDVVFYGTLDGFFKAVDARSGRPLWQFKTRSGMAGQPIAFRGPDGARRVAVMSGIGGAFGAVVANEIDRRDATAANGLANALADLPRPDDPSGTLYVFGVP